MINEKFLKKAFRKIITISLFIVIALTFSFIMESRAKGKSQVEINVPVGPSSLPAYYLQENSEIDVKTSIYKNKNIAINRLMDDKTDMALIPTNEAVKLYNKGIDIKITNIHTWGLFYVITTDPEIESLNDLKNKKIYVPEKGGPMDIIFSYIAQENNIYKDLNVEWGKPKEISKLIINDMAETVVLREPFVSQVLLNNSSAKIIIDLQKKWKNEMGTELPQASLVVKDKFSEENSDLVIKFNEEYKEAINWVNNNNSKAAQLALKYMNIKTKVTESSAPRLNLEYERAIDVKEEIDSYLELLKSYNPKTFGGKIPDEKFYF